MEYEDAVSMYISYRLLNMVSQIPKLALGYIDPLGLWLVCHPAPPDAHPRSAIGSVQIQAQETRGSRRFH